VFSPPILSDDIGIANVSFLSFLTAGGRILKRRYQVGVSALSRLPGSDTSAAKADFFQLYRRHKCLLHPAGALNFTICSEAQEEMRDSPQRVGHVAPTLHHSMAFPTLSGHF
jgi:hypothetical protein